MKHSSNPLPFKILQNWVVPKFAEQEEKERAARLFVAALKLRMRKISFLLQTTEKSKRLE